MKYTFSNRKTLATITCNKTKLISKFKVNRKQLKKLIEGDIKETKDGWRIINQ